MIGCHCHTAKGSNLRLIDSTNKTKDLIKTAAKLLYKGVTITDHESLSAHVEAIKLTRELKEKNEIPSDFKLLLGNEIYLLMEPLEQVKNNYQSKITKFPHFILIAKDAIGHKQLRILSSRAWEQSFFTSIMERTPTEKEYLEQIIQEDRGHLIATSACLGSEINIYLLQRMQAEIDNSIEQTNILNQKIDKFIKWCISTFGKENFFIEIQPALSPEQIYVNTHLVPIAKQYDLKIIVTTDAHFLRPEDRVIHKAYLNSKDGEREVDDFYEACFVQSLEEIRERLNYLDKSDVEDAINNTLLIGDMVEEYDLAQKVSIPRIDLPEFKVRHMFKPAYNQYEYIGKMAYSEEDQDKYLIKLIEDGFDEKVPRNVLSKESFHKILARINLELEELWHISLYLKEAMSAYYITIREIINIMWDDCGGNSIVGAGRGSAAGFYINYLLDITQVNPMDYNLPHWRHLHKSRPDFPDIDIDTEGSKRRSIINALKRHFGERRVLNICTFGTEGSKSAILTACRGLGIDNDIAMNIASHIPFERGANWTLSDCLFGNEEKEREPVKDFINEIEKHENLKEVALKIEGLENKRSIHAGGVFIYNGDFIDYNAMMKAPNGQWTTQYGMTDSEYMGGIKYDLLTVEALDKIRETLNLLVEYKEIEWQGTLKDTYKKYIHPDVIEYDNPRIWERMGNGEVIDLFQFNTQIGLETAKKVKPANLLETSVANSLMRLMADGAGEVQPVDQYIKFKNDISLWYQEMREEYQLNEDEIVIMENHLKLLYGIADTQEVVMLMVMDEKISSFSIADANTLRKAIAKKSKKDLDKAKSLFYEKGNNLGTSQNLLHYVWDVQIKRQLGYSFSNLHTLVYSVIALQELNLYDKYDPLFWNTACLTINSASNEEEDDEEDEDSKKGNKSTNYGKVAAAIGMMQQHNIKIGLPDINKAHFGFKPDFDDRQIVFGLKGLNSIGDEVVQNVLSHRPYASFDDFYTRLYEPSIIKKSHMLQLIKAGCFESFGNRMNIMQQFLEKNYTPKTKLNMQNFNFLVENKLIPNELNVYARYYKFRKHITKKAFKTEGKDKLYLLDNVSTEFYNEHYSSDSIVDYHKAYPIISDKLFKKDYDKKMEGIKDWLSSEDTLKIANQKLLQNEWDDNAQGNVSQWEMESLSFYYSEHELAHLNKEKYGLVNFNSLPEQPVVVGTMKFRDQSKPKFKLDCVVGTVLDRDKNKHTVTLLTIDGVITVKYYDGAFANYNKQVSRPKADGSKEILEKSWFTRGNKLLLQGYRRGSQWKPHKYNDSKYRHTTMLITKVNEDGTIEVQIERRS